MIEENLSPPTTIRFAPSALTILVVVTAGLVLLVLSSQVPAHADRYTDCNQFVVANPNRAIVGCTQVIERGNRERRRKRSKAYANRGAAYVRKGEPDRAIADLTKAIQINPNDANAYANRGNAYFDKGEHDRAIADYTKAIQRCWNLWRWPPESAPVCNPIQATWTGAKIAPTAHLE